MTEEPKESPVPVPQERKMPTKEELAKMQQESFRKQLQNHFDQSLGRSDGILRDAVRTIIENCSTQMMRIQNENEKLRNENNELKTKIMNMEGSKIPKPPLVVKSRDKAKKD